MGRRDPEEGHLPAPVKPPDGGWGWIVLLGCFVITGFSYAFPKAVSVYFKELMKDFHVGYSDTAWISSIMLAMLYGTGPVCSIMVNQFGCRPVMLIGGLLASSGMILASFTTNIIELYLTAGVLTGLGMALNFQPSLIMLGTYFDKRRPLANGLAAAGSPVFLSSLSPLGQVLLEKFGWRGGFLIMGGLLLNCCTCGAVMRPLDTGMKRKTEKTRDKYEAKEMLPMGGKTEEGISTTDGTMKAKKAKKKPRKGKKLLDFSIFSNRGFIIYTISKFILVLGLFVPPILLVNYAKDTGVPDTEAAFLLSIIGFIDIFARPACGMVAGLKWVRPHVAYLFSFSMLFNGLTDICSARASNYTGLVIFCVFFGISYGMVGALQFEVLMAIVGSQKFSSAIGLVLLIEAFAVLIGPPSAGRLVDALKNYEVIFYLAGSEVVLSALFLAMATYCCLNRGKKKEGSPEKNPAAGGGSDTEEAESDVQEAEEHSSDNHQPAHSTDNAVVAASEEANHVAEEQGREGGGCPAGDGEVLARDSCDADQTVERDSF
ncbi:monocarboxylate transporter 3 [Pezoporus flaviventris]|uniref:monocarboxylate transporter 3 n=1 Tax=Pezoporus flaviventris TaxID=889875 RepID=UPI002AAFF699|nr:monocarboxylate transporter 3 [Pezoporus flaviventris]